MCVNGEEATPVCQRGSWANTHFGLGCCCAFNVREFSRIIMGSLEIGYIGFWGTSEVSSLAQLSARRTAAHLREQVPVGMSSSGGSTCTAWAQTGRTWSMQCPQAVGNFPTCARWVNVHFVKDTRRCSAKERSWRIVEQPSQHREWPD